MKCLMVGLGSIGQRHLRNLRKLTGTSTDITAYRVMGQTPMLNDQMQVVSSLEHDCDLEERYGLRVFRNLDKALDDGPDAVFICNPSSLHIPVALKAARAGCHLFIEKPLSHNLDKIDELIEVVDRDKLVGMVGYQMRFHPCLKRLRRLLIDGAIGKIVAVRAEVSEYLPSWHPYEDYRQSYAAREHLGGGVILTQIHEIDYLLWLFGAPHRLLTIGGHLSSLEIDVEDVASILMECDVGGQRIPVHLHQDYVQRPPRRTCQVIGNDGTIMVDFRAVTVEVFDTQGRSIERTVTEGFDRNQLFLEQTQHFLDCVDKQEQPLVSIYDGAQSLRIALAAKRSLLEGHQIEFDLNVVK